MNAPKQMPICALCSKKIYTRYYANLDGDRTKPMHEGCVKKVLQERYGRRLG